MPWSQRLYLKKRSAVIIRILRGIQNIWQQAFGVKNFDMMFIAPRVRLTIVTRHVPLKDVPALITSKSCI